MEDRQPRWVEDTPPPLVALWQPAFYFGIGNRAVLRVEEPQHLMGSARQVTQLGGVLPR